MKKRKKFPDIPCIIVKCVALSDQWETDADRTPVLYFSSAKELESFDPNYYYEVYLIENGELVLSKKLSTYRI